MDVSAKSLAPASALSLRPTAVAKLVFQYYRQPASWLVLVITSLMMIYIGGAAMFWFHAIYLGEGGPAISPVLHWFIDSTAALLLAPVLFIVLPLASRYARVGQQDLSPHRFALFGGAVFAMATVPGPFVHNTFIGRGTYLADAVTRLWGDGRVVQPYTQYPFPIEAVLQVAFGLPLYIALMWALFYIARTTLVKVAR
ncbi:MAG TPA: hypothetical protein VFC19_20795 [Candidatus Limnocylindrales bacterium]|nr:hypothetical protein [Candidatus Limnocylindrales bacterium]